MMMEEDDEFLQSLTDLPDHLDPRMIRDFSISNEGLDILNRLRNNQPMPPICNNNEFSLGSLDVTFRFTDLSWKLLGRYISNNIHLKRVRLDGCETDQNMALLFSELTSSSSLEALQIGMFASSEFSINGIRCMVPFLQNSPQLKNLYMGYNNNINTECFVALVSVLHGMYKDITDLSFPNCNITGVSALDTALPNLQKLNLNHNIIGRDGIRSLSNLLRKEGSNLTHLFLQNTGIDNEGAEMIASSLKHNTKLEELYLENNNLERNGSTYATFLKLLVDISSVANTYNSNHTLKVLSLNNWDNSVLNTAPDWDKPLAWINKICNENTISDLHAAGRAKIMSYQLDRGEREILCSIQSVDCPSNIFADVDDPLLLPKVLDLMTAERCPNRIRSHARYQREGKSTSLVRQSELFVTIVHKYSTDRCPY